MKSLLLFSILALTGCTTFYPHLPVSTQPAPDSSTPKGFTEFNSGYLTPFIGKDGKEWEAVTINFHKAHPGVPGLIQINQNGDPFFAVTAQNLSLYYAQALPAAVAQKTP